MMAVRRAVAENRAGAALWIVAILLRVRMAIFVAGAVSEPSHGFVAPGGVDRSGTIVSSRASFGLLSVWRGNMSCTCSLCSRNHVLHSMISSVRPYTPSTADR